jgi:gentisate 1,2-dioxygenase
MRDKYLPGVLATDKSDHGTSEVRDREAFQVANPPLRGRAVHDLKHMELPSRAYRHNSGITFDLSQYEVLEAHISELAPGTGSVRHRHTSEAYLYVVRGSGFSLINYDDEPVEVVHWREGTLFAPPRWAWHQHFNTESAEPARYLAIQDVGLLRTMRLHNIERHIDQFDLEAALELSRTALDVQTAPTR